MMVHLVVVVGDSCNRTELFRGQLGFGFEQVEGDEWLIMESRVLG
jgi:hypothetical protein